MGCTPSAYERTEYDRYAIFDERDRDDYDDFCGCGPWYGGETYRIARREYLPGYGSPRGNYYGRGGYAGRYIPPAGLGNEVVTSSAQMAVMPYRSAKAIVAAPVQTGYIGTYNPGDPMGGYGYAGGPMGGYGYAGDSMGGYGYGYNGYGSGYNGRRRYRRDSGMW